MPQELITTAGDFTWTVPSNVTSVLVELWGPGGDGNGNTGPNAGYGGGGGEYTAKTCTVTPAQEIDGHVGTAGSRTKFGIGELFQFEARAGGDGVDGGVGGQGTTGTGITSQHGGDSGVRSDDAGGGGGESGGPSGHGTIGGNASGVTPGIGGTGHIDAGDGGGGGYNANGEPGVQPGGGGGGAYLTGSGGAGADGQVRLTYAVGGATNVGRWTDPIDCESSNRRIECASSNKRITAWAQ